MTTALIILSLVEVVLLVVVLAAYLINISARLRHVSKTLGLVTFGVRAIERQTEPIGERLREVNSGLEQAVETLDRVAGGEGRPAGGSPTY